MRQGDPIPAGGCPDGAVSPDPVSGRASVSRRSCLACLGAFLLLPTSALAEVAVAGEVRDRVGSADMVDRFPWLAPWIAEDGWDRKWLSDLLSGLEPYPQVLKMMDRQAEALPYYKYRPIFLDKARIAGGRERFRRHRELLARIEARFGVPPEVVVAIWGVESNYGALAGKHPVLRSLFTLASQYPRRAVFFQGQLREFLLLCREEGWDPLRLTGSYAGAMGQVQMIPGTMRQYAVDFDGDGVRDVFSQLEDVLASAANYLFRFGWERGAPLVAAVAVPLPAGVSISPSLKEMRPWREWREAGLRLVTGVAEPPSEAAAALITLEVESGPAYYLVFNNFRVITRWNLSSRYAMVVHELALAIRESG
ncbi:MAG: lytic murein transglycosylase [Magnetococcales bacterium]|nr:lytic murein transglycosylase [Magnetococcales bacterium]